MNRRELQAQQFKFAMGILKEHGIKPLDERMTLSGNGYNLVIHSKELVNCLLINPNMSNEDIVNYINMQIEISKRHFEKKLLEKYGLDKPSDERFHYMMLDRLRSDCEYYLGNGNRFAGHLWVSNDEKGHIELMKALWNSFPADGKPEWLTYEKILDYEKQMCGSVKGQSIDELIAGAADRVGNALSKDIEKDLDI